MGSRLWAWATATRVVMVGQFCNQILPAAIGGDLVHACYARRAGMPVRDALVTVALDRLMDVQ